MIQEILIRFPQFFPIPKKGLVKFFPIMPFSSTNFSKMAMGKIAPPPILQRPGNFSAFHLLE